MSYSNVDGPVAVPTHRRRLFREIALTVGAVAGLLCVVIALSALVFGITPLVFRSGSMSPAIETGALALSKKTPATDVQVSDVVNVKNAAGDGITHRVVEIGAISADSVELFLRGDANAERDSEPYIVTDVGRVVFSVPNLGYVVTWLSGPVAVFAGGVLVGALLMIAFRPEGRSKPAEQGSTETQAIGRHGKSTMTALLVITTVGALGISTSNAPLALAAPLTDSSVATSGTISTVLPRPASFSCTNVFLAGAQLSWPNNPLYGYELSFTPTSSGVTNPIVLGPTAGTTRTWNAGQIASLLLVGSRIFTLRATYNGFVSPPTGTRTVNFTTGLITSCATTGPAGASARSAPQETAPTTSTDPTTTVPATTAPSSTTPPTTTPSTTSVPPTTTTTPPSDEVPPPPPTVEPPAAPEETTTTPPAPVALSTPVTSPSGASTAQVVDVDGSPTLQIVDATGAVQYSAPATSSEAYGYGVNWSAGDQLWLLGPDQLVRLDGSGGSWSRSLIDPTATDQIPPEILALLN